MKRIAQNNILAISIGIVYLWFGALKFFPHISPAEDLAKDTIHQLTFGLIPSQVSIIMLAIIEVTIGMLLLTNVFSRKVIILALIHMTFTFTPLFLFLEKSFSSTPFVPTLLGQYIAKNVIIVGALITLLGKKSKMKLQS